MSRPGFDRVARLFGARTRPAAVRTAAAAAPASLAVEAIHSERRRHERVRGSKVLTSSVRVDLSDNDPLPVGEPSGFARRALEGLGLLRDVSEDGTVDPHVDAVVTACRQLEVASVALLTRRGVRDAQARAYHRAVSLLDRATGDLTRTLLDEQAVVDARSLAERIREVG